MTLTKGSTATLLYETAKKHPKEIGDIISKIKDLGNHYVTELGFSVGLNDLLIDRKKRDQILEEATKRTKTVGFDAAYSEGSKKMFELIPSNPENRFVVGNFLSGAFGKAEASLPQLFASPVAVTDNKGRTIKVQIPRSYAEGQDITSYWAALPGARRGMVQKGLGTQEVGALSKRVLNTTVSVVISEVDCGTTDGLVLPIESREGLDRVVAEGPNKGKVVDPALIRAMVGRRIKTIKVRSPLKCRSVRGICSRCFGLLENGQFPPVGYNVH